MRSRRLSRLLGSARSSDRQGHASGHDLRGRASARVNRCDRRGRRGRDRGRSDPRERAARPPSRSCRSPLQRLGVIEPQVGDVIRGLFEQDADMGVMQGVENLAALALATHRRRRPVSRARPHDPCAQITCADVHTCRYPSRSHSRRCSRARRVAKSTASHHLAILRHAGLVTIREDGKNVYTLGGTPSLRRVDCSSRFWA